MVGMPRPPANQKYAAVLVRFQHADAACAYMAGALEVRLSRVIRFAVMVCCQAGWLVANVRGMPV